MKIIIQIIDTIWNTQNQLLVEISSKIDMFKLIKKWDDLEPSHYHILISLAINHIDNISEISYSHPEVKSLHFLIGALIKKMKSIYSMEIELIKIQRVSKNQIKIDTTSSIIIDYEKYFNKKPNLKIVVDNTI